MYIYTHTYIHIHAWIYVYIYTHILPIGFLIHAPHSALDIIRIHTYINTFYRLSYSCAPQCS